MTAEAFLGELLDGLRLQRQDAEEHPVTYRLNSLGLGRELAGNHTLGELGIPDGDTLRLIRQE
jgi:hypothetical protein